MAFQQQQNVIITGFEDISISLFVPGANNVMNPQRGRIEIQLTLSDGKIKIVDYDLLARLQDDAAGQTHLSNLQSLKNYILTRIQNEVLP